jgi:glycosyltransferase involved in cell wall biosynthesis
MSSQTILIDARYCRETSTGVGNYCRFLLEALDAGLVGEFAGLKIFALVQQGRGDTPPAVPELNKIEPVPVQVSYSSHPQHEIWLNYGLPNEITRLNAGVYHNLAYSLPFKKKFPAKRVVSIHDLIVFDMPGNYGWFFRSYLKWMIRSSSRHADQIICFTEDVRDKLKQRFKIIPEQITVIPHGYSPVFQQLEHIAITAARSRHALPEHFIFAAGSPEPRKNLVTLLKGFHRFKNERDLPHKLIVAVSSPIPKGSDIQRTVNKLDLEKSVRFVQIGSPEIMRDYYNCAELFVFPTLSEGFGFPALEAMACSTPVLCSTIPPLHEIVGECADVFDPHDHVTLAKKMFLLLNDEEKRSDMSSRGLDRAKQFTWQSAAEQYLKVYSML